MLLGLRREDILPILNCLRINYRVDLEQNYKKKCKFALRTNLKIDANILMQAL